MMTGIYSIRLPVALVASLDWSVVKVARFLNRQILLCFLFGQDFCYCRFYLAT